MSADRNVGIAHRSKLQALEVFEERNVAWVDGKTLASLRLTDPGVSIILPNGKACRVTLTEAPIEPPESRYIILPRKLRTRLSIGEGTTVKIETSP